MGEKHDRRAVMKRLYIVVEGQTEQEFVNGMIAPYLHGFGIYNALEKCPRFAQWIRKIVDSCK